MALWEKVFAAGYDRFMAGTEKAGLHDMRRELLASARGRTLELGAGTGANVELYPAAAGGRPWELGAGPGPSSALFPGGGPALRRAGPAEPMARRLEAKHPHATV